MAVLLLPLLKRRLNGVGDPLADGIVLPLPILLGVELPLVLEVLKVFAGRERVPGLVEGRRGDR